jgi:uncharacterized protein YjbI with pentapeptide repeats
MTNDKGAWRDYVELGAIIATALAAMLGIFLSIQAQRTTARALEMTERALAEQAEANKLQRESNNEQRNFNNAQRNFNKAIRLASYQERKTSLVSLLYNRRRDCRRDEMYCPHIWNDWCEDRRMTCPLDASVESRAEATRELAALEKAQQQEMNLHSVELVLADLEGIDLNNTNLRYANLWHSILDDSNLSGANLRNAKLVGTGLKRSNLRGAKLTGAVLVGADLDDSDLRGADLTGAQISLERTKINIDTSIPATLTQDGKTEIEKTSFLRAKYDMHTKFPEGFDADAQGMVLQEEDDK